MNKDEKECVEFYLGNSDGRSGERLKILLIEIFEYKE